MVNFDGESLTDYKLAEGMTFGLPPELEHEVNKLDLLKRSEFQFKEFVRRTGNCYNALPKKTTRPRVGAPAATPQHSSNTNNVPREEYIWRIHSYLDSIGKCHHCKQYCGYAAGTCPGPVYCGPVEIPPNFIVPPKPVDYVAPRAWTKAQAAGSKPGALQPGRPTGRPAGVAGVAEDANTPVETPAILDEEFDFDEYHAAAVSTLTDIEASLADETDARASTAAATAQTPGSVAKVLAMERLIFENGEDLVDSFPNFRATILDGVEGKFPSDNSDTEGSEDQA
ncbi:hypothetical protein PTTG_29982 [Puccinia triticina 1-1 BBBD Race 1]|uniref:Uncharacterized protein n=1 Tax=Puccinia triticina (isolate 1-1 / race 1 (BBBD)) TaxID=630390 RepID=A0A180G1G6_PUCT1|nr:hypothetical protein PTTG_29982 [Puccinia triticina 1-1 BBBD Race 1]